MAHAARDPSLVTAPSMSSIWRRRKVLLTSKAPVTRPLGSACLGGAPSCRCPPHMREMQTCG
eukprot:1160921-Pelagomonas_calceolata.AAC.1